MVLFAKPIRVLLCEGILYASGKGLDRMFPDAKEINWFVIVALMILAIPFTYYGEIRQLCSRFKYRKSASASVRKRNKHHTPKQGERVFTARTAMEIFQAIRADGMTGIDVEHYIRPHIGKWIRVQGAIRNIHLRGDFYIVLLGRALEPVQYLVFSNGRWGRYIETMAIGDRIVAEGRIVEISQMHINIEQCEIIEGKGA